MSNSAKARPTNGHSCQCQSNANNKQQTSPQTNQPREGWTKQSKLTRILGNLERTIFRNHNRHRQDNGLASRPSATAPDATPSKSANRVAATDEKPNRLQVGTKHTMPSNQTDKIATHATLSTKEEQAAFHLAPSGNTAPSSSSSSAAPRKPTLNKFQQQLTSTLQSSPQRSAIMSNRLSIPPPHATGESRNLLYVNGTGSILSTSGLIPSSLDTNDKTAASLSSSATMRIIVDSRLAGAKESHANQNRANLSPASSAKSLPLGATKLGSQSIIHTHNQQHQQQITRGTQGSKVDDDQFGFATYQSRRSLACLNNTSLLKQQPSLLTNRVQQQEKSEMLFSPASKQVPSMMMSYPVNNQMNDLNNYHPPYTQQYQLQQQHQYQQQLIHNNSNLNSRPQLYNGNQLQQQQQHHISSTQSNKVPIMATMNYVLNNQFINGRPIQQRLPTGIGHQPPPHHHQNQQMQQQFANLHINQQRLINNEQSNTNDHIFRPHPLGAAIDCPGQIYANAPPKPRRYQYYNGQLQHYPQTLQVVTTNVPLTINSNFVATQQQAQFEQTLNNQRLVAHQFQSMPKRQQHIPTLASQQYHTQSHLSVPSLNQLSDNGNFVNAFNNCVNIQQSQVSSHIQPAENTLLIKSKSSLDCSDLARFKESRFSNVQPHLPTTNVPNYSNLQPQPIYGSSRLPHNLMRSTVDLHQTKLSTIHYDYRDATLPQQQRFGNLQRSKSVTHLLPVDSNDQYNISRNSVASKQLYNNGMATIGNGVAKLPDERSIVETAANSQLIVDLTTPRVLTKTQTTLLANRQPAMHMSQQRINYQTPNDSLSSINQSGLPIVNANDRQQNSNQTAATNSKGSPSSSESFPNSTSSAPIVQKFNKPEPDAKKSTTNELERTAPYYYSDLKSDEQRKALLSIVQQKSLSPPPQLLSRSTDQSSTRLALHNSSVSRRVQDIEMRHQNGKKNQSCHQLDWMTSSETTATAADKKVSTNSTSNNPFANNETILNYSPPSRFSEGKSSARSEGSLDSSNVLDADDDDFIEFVSNSNHHQRSQFEASQFSSSDFSNTSSSSDGNGNKPNAGLAGSADSFERHLEKLVSERPMHQTSVEQAKNVSNNVREIALQKEEPQKVGILKQQLQYEEKNACNMNSLGSDSVSSERKQHSDSASENKSFDLINDDVDCDSISTKRDRLDNVFGNVVDVEICPLTNLSQCLVRTASTIGN